MKCTLLAVFLLIISTVSFSSNAVAISTTTTTNIQSPHQVISNAGQRLFSRISDEQWALKKFPILMQKIVEEELMPSIDYKYAAFKVLGKNLRKISKPQREEFANSMRMNLIKTYALALAQYKNQEVIFEPSKKTKDARIVGVNAVIKDIDAPEIKITFQMRQNKKTKEWKVYDMIIEGISLLDSKRVEISKRIKKSGIDQVTLELAYIS